MTAIEQLNGLRGQLDSMRPPPGDALGSLGKLNALVTLLNQVKAVPSPPGDPGWIGAYAASLSTMADTWDSIRNNLTTSQNVLLAAWSGVTAEDAAALINGMGRDVDDMVAAFRAAAAALDNWVSALTAAQRLDTQTLDRLNGTGGQQNLFGEISSIQHSAGLIITHDVFSDSQDKSPAAVDADAANQEYGRTAQVWADAEQIISQRITAAQNAWNGANELATTLDNLAGHGIPVGPNGQRVSGATDLLSALTKSLPTPDGTAPGDAAAAAALITLANSGQPLTPGEKAELQGILAKEDTNPEFSTDLLNAVGPAGFLQFVGANQGDLATVDESALVLATATDAAPGQPTVSPAWTEQLKQACKANNGAGYVTLGTLLATEPNAFQGTDFLVGMGNDLIQYEITNGGSKRWNTVVMNNPNQPLVTDPTKDPVYDLMLALKGNPGAATRFFSEGKATVSGLPDSVGMISADPTNLEAPDSVKSFGMVDYLLDRNWTEDGPYVEQLVPPSSTTPGMSAFGAALDVAAGQTTDPASRRLAAYVVHDIGHERGDIPAGLTDSMTDLMTKYIFSDDVNQSLNNNIPLGTLPLFDAPGAKGMLQKLAANGGASTLENAALSHLALGLNNPGLVHYWEPKSPGQFTYESGLTLGTIAKGNIEGHVGLALTADQRANLGMEYLKDASDAITTYIPTGNIIPVIPEAQWSESTVVTGGQQSIIGHIVDHFEQHTAPGELASSTTQAGDAGTAVRNMVDGILNNQPAYQSPPYSLDVGGLQTGIQQGFDQAMGLNIGDPSSDLKGNS